MASLNKVLIIGNLTRDPELRYIPSGVAVVKMGVAVSRRYRDKNGEQKEDVCFVTAVAWDKQAEICNQYLRKGYPVFIEGRLQYRSWETQEGTKRSVIEIRVERIQFLSRPGGGNQQQPAAAAPEPGSAVPLPDEIKEAEMNLQEV